MAEWLSISLDDLLGRPYREVIEREELDEAAYAARVLAPPVALLEETSCVTFVVGDQKVAPKVAHAVRMERVDDVPLVWVWVTDREIDIWHDAMLEREAEASRLRAQLLQLQRSDRVRVPPALIGQSDTAARVRTQIATLACRLAPTVIWGPPGIGREEVARYLIACAEDEGRVRGDLFPIACSLMDGQLLQSSLELFTAAVESQEAAGLLLMEVDRLPVEVQSVLKLFLRRAATERELVVIATARADLMSLGEAFDDELALLLSTFSVRLPSLAERPGDIPLVAQHVLEETLGEAASELCGFETTALDRMASYAWPENVAELAEVVGQAVAMAEGPLIRADALPELFDYAEDAALHPRREFEPIQLDGWLEEIERELLRRALLAARGNKTEAARLLGVSRQRVIRRAAQWGLEPWSASSDE